MIGQVYELGTGFKGEVLYLLYGHLDNLNPDRVDWIETRNLPTDDPLAAARIMAATARDRRTKQKPVYHFSISFDYGDPADRALMLRVADRLLSDLKMQGYQALMVAHRDRAHAHLHIVVNRIHPEELTVWSNWNDYWRMERSLRGQEAELGLRVVPGFHAPVFDDNGNRLKPAQLVRGDINFLERARAEAGPHLASAGSWAELERELAAHGLRVRMKGRGMVVTDGKHEVKASDIDRAFSRSRLEARARLGIYGEYRLRQRIAALTLDERAARVEQAMVADASPHTSTPAARTPDVSSFAEPEPEPMLAYPTEPTRQEEGDTRDPAIVTVADGRVDAEMPVPSETPRKDRVTAAADAPPEGRRPTPEAVIPAERHRDEARDREEVTAEEPADAWYDARGVPRRFDPTDYGTVPRVAGSVPGPIGDRPGAAPARSVGPLKGDVPPSPTEATEPMRPGRPQPLRQPVVPGEPAVPVRKKVHPPTRREEYETALVNLTGELKSLFFDPHAVRRAFAEDACVNGREHAIRTLAETPEQYGRLSFIAKRERLPEAVRWGGVYATWQEERTRPATRRAAALYRLAAQIEATDRLLRHAKDVADQKAREIASIEKQSKNAETAVGKEVEKGAGEVYVEPHMALVQITACRKTKGLDEVVNTLRHAPEQFGELRAEKQMFGSLRTPKTGAARKRAETFANEVHAAYTALANRHDPGELERAREAHREARHAVDAASRAQIRLPSTPPEDYVREAGDVLRRAARGSIGRAERMADQLIKMLPTNAITLARKALSLVRAAERDRAHERGGRGRDF